MKYLQLAPSIALGATITVFLFTLGLLLQRMGVLP